MAEKKMAGMDPVKWIERNFYIPETKNDPRLKGRIGLEDYQRDAIREAFSKEPNGNYKYSIIVWSDIKKSYKSTIAAAVNLFVANHTEYGECYVVANDLKQANSRVQQYIRRGVELNPDMRKKCRITGYRVDVPSGSYIEAIPIDPSGEAGSNADLITFSELWGANEEAKQKMWAEMTIPPGKHGKAFRWVESYAGFAGESQLLYSLYELGVRQGRLLWPDRLYPVTEGASSPLELYVNDEARMLCLWNTQPRCPSQTKDYYASEAKILPDSNFQRMHRNQWVSSTETFVPMSWVTACDRSAEWPEIPKKQPMIVAMDAGISDDNFGLVMGARHPVLKDEVIIEYHQKWQPKAGHKIDFQGTDDHPGPEKVLDRLIRDYNVVEVAYDPYQLFDLCNRKKKEGRAWFRAFNQGNDRLIADSQLRSLIRDRKIWHRGEKDLIEHFQNADAKVDTEDTKVRIVKRGDQLKVDLAVATSMMAHEVLRLNL